MQKLKEFFKTYKKEKITAICFIMFMAVMFCGMLPGAEAFYVSFIETYRSSVPTGAPVIERLEGAIDAAESSVNDAAFARQKYVELYGAAQLAMQKRVITDYNYGSLYKTLHDQITFAVGERYVDDAANATYQLVNRLIQEKIDFLYVQLPFKIPPEEYQESAELPAHVRDYSNQNADTFVDMLTAANVKAYDLRKDFWESGYGQNELFFDTDHHWTIEGAFLGVGLLADYLNENYDFGIAEDLYTYDNFNKNTYKDYFVGSMGRRVGRIYGGIDDFSLITPAFDTHIRLTQVEGLGETVFEGSFEEAVLEMDYINAPDLTANRYAVYHGDYQELRFLNENASSDKSVLIIKDSFGIPVYSFLSLGVREVRAIDMRLFEMNVAEYAAEYKPDLVILMYNADSYLDPMFDFNPNVNNEEYREWLESL